MQQARIPAVRKAETEGLIASVEGKIEAAQAALRALAGDNVTPASELVAKRNKLINEIAALKQEREILEGRQEREKADAARREHNARMERVRAILKRREMLMRTIDDAFSEAAEAAKEVHAIDKEELLELIGGIESRFSVQRGDWQVAAIHKLGALGLGVDTRMDKAMPHPTGTEYAQRLHDAIFVDMVAKFE